MGEFKREQEPYNVEVGYLTDSAIKEVKTKCLDGIVIIPGDPVDNLVLRDRLDSLGYTQYHFRNGQVREGRYYEIHLDQIDLQVAQSDKKH